MTPQRHRLEHSTNWAPSRNRLLDACIEPGDLADLGDTLVILRGVPIKNLLSTMEILDFFGSFE